MGSENLLLRVGLALSIVSVAIGLTFAAPNSFGRFDERTTVSAASAAPVVAGYEAAPLADDRVAAPNPSTTSTEQAATLIALATTVVLLAIFVILFSYRPRPGGVRASQR